MLILSSATLGNYYSILPNYYCHGCNCYFCFGPGSCSGLNPNFHNRYFDFLYVADLDEVDPSLAPWCPRDALGWLSGGRHGQRWPLCLLFGFSKNRLHNTAGDRGSYQVLMGSPTRWNFCKWEGSHLSGCQVSYRALGTGSCIWSTMLLWSYAWNSMDCDLNSNVDFVVTTGSWTGQVCIWRLGACPFWRCLGSKRTHLRWKLRWRDRQLWEPIAISWWVLKWWSMRHVAWRFLDFHRNLTWLQSTLQNRWRLFSCYWSKNWYLVHPFSNAIVMAANYGYCLVGLRVVSWFVDYSCSATLRSRQLKQRHFATCCDGRCWCCHIDYWCLFGRRIASYRCDQLGQCRWRRSCLFAFWNCHNQRPTSYSLKKATDAKAFSMEALAFSTAWQTSVHDMTYHIGCLRDTCWSWNGCYSASEYQYCSSWIHPV